MNRSKYLESYHVLCYAPAACGDVTASDQVPESTELPPGTLHAPADFRLLAEGARKVLEPILLRGRTYATLQISFV
jgi:hypothetical protein